MGEMTFLRGIWPRKKLSSVKEGFCDSRNIYEYGQDICNAYK